MNIQDFFWFLTITNNSIIYTSLLVHTCTNLPLINTWKWNCWIIEYEIFSLLENANYFPKCLYQAHPHKQGIWVSRLHILANSWNCQIFAFLPTGECEMVPRAGFPSNGSDDEWWGLSFVRAVPTRGSSPATCLSTSFVLFLPSFWASVYCSTGVVVYSGYQSLSVMFYKSLHLWFVLSFVYEWKCHSYIINLIRIFFYHLCCLFISESFHIWRLDVLRCFHIKFEIYVFSLTRMHFCP